jgi:hypothetical protein
MRTKRETKNNAKISQAFNINRFLWPFATQYMKAKSEGNLDQFWASAGTTLESFDQKHPTSRRDLASIDSANVGQDLTSAGKGSANVGLVRTSTSERSATIGPQARSNPGTSSPSTVQESKRAPTAQPSKKEGSATLGHVSTSYGQGSAVVGHLTTTGHESSAKGSAIVGHSKTTGQESSATLGHALTATGNAKTPSSSTPISLRNNPRTRSISPIAGPSRPRQALPSATLSLSSITSSSSSGLTNYSPRRIKVRTNSASFEYEQSNESDNVAEELPTIHVKRNKTKGKGKGKGKAKAKEVVPRVDVKKERKPPQSAGEERDPPCKRCARLKKMCYNQIIGVSCMNCATLKLRCENPPVRVEKKSKRIPERSRDMGTWPRGLSPLPTSRLLRAHVAGDNEITADDNGKS